MKFKTQHKNFTMTRGGIKKETYRANRDGKSVWVSGGEKGTILYSKEMSTVREAKAFMERPHIS